MKMVALLSCVLFIGLSLSAQFSIGYNKTTGAVSSIMNPDDKYKMNWIFSSQDSIPTYQKKEQDWGMGKYNVADEKGAWTIPTDVSITNNSSTIHYSTSHLLVDIVRSAEGKFFTETYRFHNTTGKTITIDSLCIYTPFNDNYPSAKICATNRCNAHIWPGLNSSYVNAIRMDGVAPHLGLMFTEGAMKSYSVENRGIDGGGAYKISNTRGTILLNMPTITLKPNEDYTVQWKLFWHTGWDDLFTIAKTLGYVRADADKYVMNQNETVNVQLDAATGLKNKSLTLPTSQLGEHSLPIMYGNNKQTLINYYVISSPQNIIDKRVHFIVDHQQMNNPNDFRYGAYMVYDNEGDSIFLNNKNSSDKNEGRERVGIHCQMVTDTQGHKHLSIVVALCILCA